MNSGGRPRQSLDIDPDAERRGRILEDLRKAVKLNGRSMSQTELANRINTDQSYVSKLERGVNDVQGIGARKFSDLAQALELSVSQLAQALEMEEKSAAEVDPMLAIKEELEYVQIRVYGKVSAGSDSPEPLEGQFLGVPADVIKRLRIRNPQRELAGYVVNVNSMFYSSPGARARGLKHGDYITVHRFGTPMPDDIVVAWDKLEEKMLVKLFDEGDSDDWVVFRSVNSTAHPPITRHKNDIHIYGVVVWKAGRP